MVRIPRGNLRSRSFGDGDRKSDVAYRALKGAIVRNEIAPGDLLVEQDLMQSIGVGRTPLREAMQRLEAEGLVTTVPRRGTFASQFDAHDVRAVYELRCQIDAFAAELAAERASPIEVARMESLLEEAAAQPDGVEAAEFDEAMHGLIVEAAHNPLLEEFHRRLYLLTIRVLSVQGIQRESLAEMVAEFTAIVDAIRRRDPLEAGRATLRHVMARGWFPDLDPHVPVRIRDELAAPSVATEPRTARRRTEAKKGSYEA